VDILLLERWCPRRRLAESRHAWSAARTGQPIRSPAQGDLQGQALVLPRKVVITREFLDFAPLLRAVARMHVGSDNTDLEACRDARCA
jgi:D-3-phosphoglycerate dehydrogenase